MKKYLPLLFVALTGCANLSLTDVYQAPTFRYQSTKITQVSFSELSAASVVQIHNGNPYQLPVNSLGAELWLAGQPLLELDSNPIAGLRAGRDTEIVLNWGLVFADLLQRSASAYKNGEAELTLKLSPALNVPLLGPQTLNWQSRFTVPIPKLPSLQLSGWRVAAVSLTSVRLALDLQLVNPNSFAVDTQGWSLAVKNDQRALATLDLRDSAIKAGSQSTQQVDLTLALADVGLALLTSLKSGTWPASLAVNWAGAWRSPDLAFALPAINGQWVAVR
ncbi:hypothetical protein [Reinekea sp.]|jgi:LEA14-like dessication related protein|uniref:hypothetical protein n=1 Tax=Reinekea sp. TaxID=1970455 RepID=UPI002A84105A|nr:hypothetical protein [Reinekea sp.]